MQQPSQKTTVFELWFHSFNSRFFVFCLVNQILFDLIFAKNYTLNGYVLQLIQYIKLVSRQLRNVQIFTETEIYRKLPNRELRLRTIVIIA